MVCQALLALNSVALDQMTADGRLAQALTLPQDMTNSSILSIEQLEFILDTLPQPAEGQSVPPFADAPPLPDGYLGCASRRDP